MKLTDYAKFLTNAVLENDDPMDKPMVRSRRGDIRASGWLKGSDRTMFMAIFVYEEMYALRVNIRSNGNGCFHYPAVPKAEITPKNTSELAERIISDIKSHIESKM
jgi:hypothetical protein